MIHLKRNITPFTNHKKFIKMLEFLLDMYDDNEYKKTKRNIKSLHAYEQFNIRNRTPDQQKAFDKQHGHSTVEFYSNSFNESVAFKENIIKETDKTFYTEFTFRSTINNDFLILSFDPQEKRIIFKADIKNEKEILVLTLFKQLFKFDTVYKHSNVNSKWL